MKIDEFSDVPLMLKNAVIRALTAQHDGRLFEADRLYHQMARREPLHPLLANTIADFQLLKGNYAEAWRLSQRRLELHYYTHRPFARLSAPMWTGEPLPGGRLLIFCDMGLGDTILLARFLPWVLDRVGHLSMQVNPETASFWRRRFPDVTINEIGQELASCDARINMFCLPRLFGANRSNIPRPPYITADPDTRAAWRERLGGGFKVGLSWQGNPSHARDAERSVPLKLLLPLLRNSDLRQAGVRFFSLQLSHGRDQLADLPDETGLVDLGAVIAAEDDPLEQAAALVEELELVIAVDSALANLAGAMDRPFWLPTYKVPDWRWQIYPTLDAANPEVAPWYGAQRVFSCVERGHWEPLVEAMTAELHRAAGAKLLARLGDATLRPRPASCPDRT